MAHGVAALQAFYKESCPEAARRAALSTRRHGIPDGGRHRLVYKVSFLVHVIVMSFLLRGSASLRESVVLALKLVLPPSILTQFVCLVEEKACALPDAGSISRWRFLLDASLMLVERKGLAEGGDGKVDS